MNLPRFRIWLAILCWSAGLVLLTVSVLPLGRSRQATPMPHPALEDISGATPLIERRLIRLDWPQRMRVSDSASIDLSIVPDEDGSAAPVLLSEAAGAGDIYEAYNPVVVARLETASLAAPRAEIREPLRPGWPATFRWNVRPGRAGSHTVVVWLHLELVPQDGGQVERVLLLARTVNIEAVTVLGLNAGLARSIGLAGLMIGAILSFSSIRRRRSYG